jgi:DNA polymerase III delta prime subunit
VDRKRSRKRRRLDSEDELDVFIALSDDEDDTIPDQGEKETDDDDFNFCRRTRSRLQRKNNSLLLNQHPPTSDIGVDTIPTSPNYQTSDTNFTDILTNTIIITGPPGCGKSAAVYACADELGWEVFEVYPGIGRRNGANLDNLVGDVGKNHLIQQTRPKYRTAAAQCDSRASAALSTLFPKAEKVNPKPSPTQSDTEHPSDVDTHVLVDAASESLQDTVEPPVAVDELVGSLKTNGPAKLSATARQSLILLEEVDILFKEDAGFWPAVVELIKECRRPVIMTCNDIKLVPVADLPLQSVLTFQPCPSEPAVTFLQCLCVTQGYAIPRDKLIQLYETTYIVQSMDLPDAPLNPRTEPPPLPDLRRSITQLQLICADATHEAKVPQEAQGAAENFPSLPMTISAKSSADVSETTTEELWRWATIYTDCVSYTDSYLCRAPLDGHEALSYNLSECLPDDELGHSILIRPSHVSDTRDALAFYHNDELIVQDAIHLSRGKHEVLGAIPITTSINPAASGSNTDMETRLFRARVEHQTQMLTALQDIVQPPAPLMPQSSVYLDYIPWVRFMVKVDDILERLAWDEMEKVKSGRLTRNSMKARHIRTIDLREDQHRALVTTRIQGLEEG